MRHTRLLAVVLLLGGCAQAPSHYGVRGALPAPRPAGGEVVVKPFRTAMALRPGAAATSGALGGPLRQALRNEIAIELPRRTAESRPEEAAYEEADRDGRWSYRVIQGRGVSGDQESYLRVANAYAAPILSTKGWRFWETVGTPEGGELDIVPVRRIVECDRAECRFTEVLDVALDADAVAAARRGALRLTLKSKSGDTKTLFAAGPPPAPGVIPPPPAPKPADFAPVLTASLSEPDAMVVCRENGVVLPRSRSRCLGAGGAVLADIAADPGPSRPATALPHAAAIAQTPGDAEMVVCRENGVVLPRSRAQCLTGGRIEPDPSG